MWNLQHLMDTRIRQRLFLVIVIFGIVCLLGCDTPYTGFLRAGDIDKYVENAGEGTICLADGFDSICIRTIAGKDGKDGRDGRDGSDGLEGRDGAIVTLALEKIVTEKEIVKVPVIEKVIFLLHVSRTEVTYHTPLGSVYVPENAPIQPPEGVKVTPVETPEDVPKTDTPPPMRDPDPPPPVVQPPLPPDMRDCSLWNLGESWHNQTIYHVMYRKEGSRLVAHVYEREGDYPSVQFSMRFGNEIQGTRIQARCLYEMALEEENATRGTVTGVQGVVN